MTGMEMFLLCGVLGSVSGQFFHETSGVTLKPSGGLETSDFGFSIAYLDKSPATLVVGAPREDYVGKVYSCPLSDLSSVNCSVIDMTSLQIERKTAEARNAKNPETNYFFGSSIAATSDYFFTCAPLLTKSIKIKREGKRENFPETFGGCFVNNYTTSRYSEWIDSAARLEDKHRQLKKYHIPISFNNEEDEEIIGGALGWNTLVDDSFLIAAKSGFKTDILYTNAEHPLDTASKSLHEDNDDKHFAEFNNYFNLGYGLAVGNFFNKLEKLYAVSVKTDLDGMILFLQKKYDKVRRGYYLDMMHEIGSRLAYIQDKTLSSMFGYAMAAADVNSDGLSELLVGAPTQTDEGSRELGALHIYVGGDLLSRNDKKRMRTVLADKVDGRFGSAIATSDVDGDGIPEIFVSAPYEGSGVVYALSGYELKQVFFREDGFKLAKLSDLKLTQELRGDGEFKLFGFSLQVVEDVDSNGCDELAIGAPDSSSVKLVRCMPAVNTSLSLELLGDSIVAVDAESFTIQVCLNVTINKKCQLVSGNISLESFTNGHTEIVAPKFTYNIKTDKQVQFCEKIKVNLRTKVIDIAQRISKLKWQLTTNIVCVGITPMFHPLTRDFIRTKVEQTDYTFTTKLSMRDDPNPSAYNSWAVFSAYSEKEKSIQVRRYCTGAHCEPDLSYKTFWSGNATIDFSKSEVINETLTFQLTNANNEAHYVVLELMVKGAVVLSGECAVNKNIINGNDDVKAYTCAVAKMLKKGDSYNMTVPIYLASPYNSRSLDVSAKLYDAVFPNKTFEDQSLVIPYQLEAGDVTVNGSSNSLNVTDKDLEGGIKFVASSVIQQEFIIFNNGPVTWFGLLPVLQIKKEYIQRVTVATRPEYEKWVQHYDPNDISKIIFQSQMTLMPKSKKIIEVSIRLSTDKLESDVSKSDLSIISELSFVLDPLIDTREAKSSTQIVYNQILTVGNKKWLIILIVVILAVLLLLILMLVLYKHGFFKRAEKKKLSVLRETIRKRSVVSQMRLASENSGVVRPSVADGDYCDIEVLDECAFHEVEIAPVSTRSTISLIETSPREQTS